MEHIALTAEGAVIHTGEAATPSSSVKRKIRLASPKEYREYIEWPRGES